MTPLRAFTAGIVWIAIYPKAWVTMLAAITAIDAADVGQPSTTLTFIAFIVLAALGHLTLIATAFVLPDRSDALLTRFSAWLSKNNRAMVVGACFVLDVFFLANALRGLGVI